MTIELLPLDEMSGWAYPEDIYDAADIADTDIEDPIAVEWAEWMAAEELADYDPPCCTGRENKWNPASWCGCRA